MAACNSFNRVLITLVYCIISFLSVSKKTNAQSPDAEARFGKGSIKERTTNSEKTPNGTIDHHITIFRDANKTIREFIDTTYDSFKNGTEISDIYLKQYDPSGNLIYETHWSGKDTPVGQAEENTQTTYKTIGGIQVPTEGLKYQYNSVNGYLLYRLNIKTGEWEYVRSMPSDTPKKGLDYSPVEKSNVPYAAIKDNGASSPEAEKRFGEGSTVQQIDSTEKSFYNNSHIEHHITIYRDRNGTIREFADTIYDSYKNGTEISDIYLKKYDCLGNLLFDSHWSGKDTPAGGVEESSQIRYEVKEGLRVPVDGLKYETMPGAEISNYYHLSRLNTKTGEWEYISDLPMATSDDILSLKPAKDEDCLPPLTINNNIVFIGPSFHRESLEGESENFFGGIMNYSRLITEQFVATADVAAYFKKDGNVNTNKIFIMGGAGFYPFKQASFNDKLSFSVHALAGLCSFKQKYSYSGGSSKIKENSFVYAAGVNVNMAIVNSYGISFQADYGRTKLFDNNQNNILVTIGVTKKFGQQ